jgi:PAS domain S-box-containing protein
VTSFISRDLRRPPRGHTVRFYNADWYLCDVVARYVRAGLELGEAVVVIATAEHRDGIERVLGTRGVEPQPFAERGQLLLLDAERTLASFMRGGLSTGEPDPAAFRRVIGGLVEGARGVARQGKVRAYGEMVNLLLRRRNPEATTQLERLWNELSGEQGFELCCAYQLDAFGHARDEKAFAAVCALHAAVIPTESYHETAGVEEQRRQIAELQQRALALQTEIEERKQAERVLRQRERELVDFLENATEGVHWVGPEGRILWANRAELELLGYDSDEYIGRQLAEFHADPAVAKDMLARLCRGESLRNHEVRLRAKSGEIKHVLVNSSAYFDEGRFAHSRCFSRDVTEWKRAQAERDVLLERERAARAEAERANSLKDEFLAIVSHELRTPLNAIVGWAHVLRSTRGLPKDQVTRALETIERNATIQNQIVSDILDISRITSGKLLLSLQQVDAAEVVVAAVETIRPAAQGKRVEVEAFLQPGAPSLWADPERLQQVVWNLLSNAVKFTPPGGRVTVSLAQVEARVEITVADTGRGIGPEFLPHVFERFRQCDSSSSRSHGGLGLGLAIVKHVVDLHGGRVEATSQGEGRGSAFRISLPVMPLAGNRPSGSSASRTRLDGTSVLVVDDHADGLDLVATILDQLGAVVYRASDAATGLALLRQKRPSVLVSDIEMPGESGYDLVAQVRALPACEGGLTPAVALTAYARGDDRERVLVAGFQAHLSKPTRADQLATTIAAVVKRRQPRPD